MGDQDIKETKGKKANMENDPIEDYNDVNIFQEFMKRFEREISEMGHANLIIAGKTGVGKSTLVNSAFRKDVAETGVGKPVTNDIRLYEEKGFPLRIYDTMGLELSPERQEEAIKQIKNLCKEKTQKGNKDELIHVMWYCVNGNGARFEPFEEKFVNTIAEDMPVIVVLTETILKNKANELKGEIEKLNTKAGNIIVVRAKSYIGDDGEELQAFGVDKLVEFTYSILPEAAQKAWANAQKASLTLKQDRAHTLIMATAATAFGEGYIPLPFSDSAALIPTQIGMLAGITAIYGFDISKSLLTGIVSSLAGTAATTIGGRAIVTNLLKMIPGAGTVIGGTISGSTAALLTTALGETYVQIMNLLCKGEITVEDLETGKAGDLVTGMFTERLKRK